MFDQKSDETLMRAKRRAMNADRRLLGVVAIFVNQIEPARLREIDLVGRNRKLTTDYAPSLDVDLRSIKRGLVGHFDVIDPGILEHVARHHFGLLPKLRFIDKLLSELGRVVRGEA